MVSRSRSSGASPSLRKHVRGPELMRTVSPMTIRSNGLSSTRSGTFVSCSTQRASFVAYDAVETWSRESTALALRLDLRDFLSRWRRGLPRRRDRRLRRLAEQLQHALLRLV